MMWETLAQPAWQGVTVALLHFLWQGCLIGAVLWVALRWWEPRAPETRYAIALAGLALMGLAPLLTYLSCCVPAGAQSGFGAKIVAAVEAPDVRAWLAGAQPGLLFAWLGGVGLLGTRLVAGSVGLVWLRRGRVEVRGPLAERAGELGRRLGVPTAGRVFASARVAQAVALGYFRPIVVLPLCWMTELPPDVLEAVIAHELAHIRRWDLWANLTQRLIETFLFYHPAVWWVSREVRRQRELCCDQLAVAATGRRAAYAQALESVARRVVCAPSLALATSFAGDQNMFLLDRVQSVLGLRRAPLAGRWWPVGLVALVFPLAASLASIGLAPEHGPKALAQAEGGRPVRTRDGERRPAYRPAEGDRGAWDGGERSADQAQTPREAALMQMLTELRQEVDQLRGELNEMRGNRPTASSRTRAARVRKPAGRTGAEESAAESDESVTPREGEGAARRGPREGDPGAERKPGPRDGDEPARRGPREGDPGAERKPGPRDGDEPARRGPREGDPGASYRSGTREGDRGSATPRGPREGDSGSAR